MPDLGETIAANMTVRPIDRRVRVHYGSFTLVDTDKALLFHERGRQPVFFVPRRHLPVEFLHEDGRVGTPKAGRPARYWDFSVGGQTVGNGIWSFERPQDELAELAGYVAFDAAQVALEIADGEDDDPTAGMTPSASGAATRPGLLHE